MRYRLLLLSLRPFMKRIRTIILGLIALSFVPCLLSSCDDAEEGIRYRATKFEVGNVSWRNDVSAEDRAVISELIQKMTLVESCHFYMGGQSKVSTRANYAYGFSSKDTIWCPVDAVMAYWRDLKSHDTVWYNPRDFAFIDTLTTKRASIPYTTVYKNGACWVGPVIEVEMPDYYIGKFEITQSEWMAVMHRNPTGKFCVIPETYGESWYEEIGKGDDIAAYNIWYQDAVAFCEELSDITGLPFRLPTEAEWECAARGGKYCRGYRYAGTDETDIAGWTYYNAASSGYSKEKETDFGVHRGGLKIANELGIYDMCGNVSEWVSNAYYRYSATDAKNPQGRLVQNNGQDTLILRGGSWMQKKSADFALCNRKYCIMNSYSSEESKQSAFVNCGFRICLSRGK